MTQLHPHVSVLEKIYADFAKGDAAAVLASCADGITFQVAGKSKLAGKYTKVDFGPGFMSKIMQLSEGTLKVEVHDILASDRHAVVLVSDHLQKNGEKVQIRAAHVWRFEGGKPVAWYEYPRDLYQFDAIWS